VRNAATAAPVIAQAFFTCCVAMPPSGIRLNDETNSKAQSKISKEKRPLERTGRKCEDNIKMDFREIRRDGVDCIRLNQDTNQCRALVNTAMNLPVPLKKVNFLTG
jgi:hypothetical protein